LRVVNLSGTQGVRPIRPSNSIQSPWNTPYHTDILTCQCSEGCPVEPVSVFTFQSIRE
jgi:hypothetical protein